MRHLLLVVAMLLCLVLTVPGTAIAQAYMTETGHAQFTSSVPLHSFNGTSDHLVGRIDLNDNSVDFYVDLTTLATGIGRRDRDVRRTLNTDQHPFAEFYGELVSTFDPENGSEQPARVRGDFTMNGVTQEVEVEGMLQMTDEGIRLEADWNLNMRDYEVEPPRLLFVEVNEVQEIYIEAVLAPES